MNQNANQAKVNIELRGVSKTYKGHHGTRTILQNASMRFLAGENYGILGGNGAGKSTLLRLLAGSDLPDHGTIIRNTSVSFPLGFAGTFHPELSGRANARFLARVYNLSASDVAGFVHSFSELKEYFDAPLKTYSSGMMAKFAFGVSLALDFNVYLIDEVTEVGDARFREKCLAAFEERVLRSDIIIVSHNPHTIRTFCTKVAVIKEGAIIVHDDARMGLLQYEHELTSGPPMELA